MNFQDWINPLYDELAAITGSRVRCSRCGKKQEVDAAECFRHGWPKCHGQTMLLDPIKERPAAGE